MDRQKILLGALSAVIVLAVLVFVYQQQNQESADTMTPKMMKQVEDNKPKPIPTTVDGVTAEIEGEATLDEAALNEEVTAETGEVQEDSKTLNNLSESYDANSL
jgi:hypothetical protein